LNAIEDDREFLVYSGLKGSWLFPGLAQHLVEERLIKTTRNSQST